MKNLILSPQQLDTLNRCPREYFFRYPLNRTTIEINKAFSEGEFLHFILETYYRQRKNLSLDLESVIEIARTKALESTLTIEETEYLIKLFQDYQSFHQNETWEIEEIEVPFTKILHEDQKLDLRIILKGKMDLLIKSQGIGVIVDHKKISQNKTPSPRSNQILTYCWAGDRKDFIINQLGTQKTLKPEDKFKRHYFTVSTDQINEWIEMTIYSAFEATKFWDNQFWPARYYNCWNPITGKRCDFSSVCLTPQSNWETILLENYQKRPDHELMKTDEIPND